MVAIIAFAALFLGGGVLGLTLAEALAPDSWVAHFVSLFALPAAFAASVQVWYGLALLSVIPRLFAWLRGAKVVVSRSTEADRPRLPGAFVFLPISSGAGALAGILVGLLSTTRSAWVVALVYWLAGTAHGLVAWRLARAGYLLPPDAI